MTSSTRPPHLAVPGSDVSRPVTLPGQDSFRNIARICGGLSGGKDNYEADRAIACKVPETELRSVVAVRQARDFLRRAVRIPCCEIGIHKFPARCRRDDQLATAGTAHGSSRSGFLRAELQVYRFALCECLASCRPGFPGRSPITARCFQAGRVYDARR